MSTRSADTESLGGSPAWRDRLLTTLRRRGAIVVLILVVAVSAVVFDNFLTEQNLENIGLLIARARMAPFIVTLAGLLGIRGLALALAGEKPIGIGGSSPFDWFGQGQILGISVPVVFVIIAFAVGGLVLARTSYGRIIFAIGGSEESARLMGLPVDRTKVIAYTTSGALA